ncbi:hypothetical protein ACTFIZ_010629 [Dictyostelium cf. discoideum]
MEQVCSVISKFLNGCNKNYDNKKKLEKLKENLIMQIPYHLDRVFLGDTPFDGLCIKCETTSPIKNKILCSGCNSYIPKQRERFRKRNLKIENQNKIDWENHSRVLEKEEKKNSKIKDYCKSDTSNFVTDPY